MRKYLLLLLGVLLCVAVQAQTTIYVSSVVNDDSGDGSSWENAKKHIASALTLLNGNPGTIFVMAGEYNISAELQIPTGVTVLGGYSQNSIGTDTAMRNLPGVNSHWHDNSYCTIIKGDGTHRIATVSGTLDGCVVRDGFSTTRGGGVLIDGGIVRYCVLMGCDAIDEVEATAEGGGAYIRNNGTLTNCVVTECRGDNGSAVSGESGSLINNTITRNWPSQCGTVTDYEGNVYHSVRIGNQCWMRENLRTTHYADGTTITTSSGTSTTTPYYYYSNHDNNIALERYGLLYNWAAVMNGAESSDANPSGVQGICPNGWHVPSLAEWEELINYVTSIPTYRCGTGAGSIAKALASREGWDWYPYSCTPGNYQENNNASRFAATSAGMSSGGTGGVGYRSWIWSATVNGTWTAYRFTISYSDTGASLEGEDKGYGQTVRCVKDDE